MSDNRTRRASDLVMTHLRESLRIDRLPAGTRLPAAVELAGRLGVSQGTVKNVYRRLAGEGKVRMRSGDGSFWMGARNNGRRVYHIGIDGGRFPDGRAPTRWSHLIYGGMMHGKLAEDLSVQFRLCGNLSFAPDGTLKVDVPMLGELDGVLLATSRRHARDQILFEGREIPCIGFNAFHEDATRNFVAPDYFAISRRLGEAWRLAGKRRIVCLISPALEHSVSVRMRYGGLLCGLEAGEGTQRVRLVTAPVGLEECGHAAMRELLAAGRWRPDAVYAAGDLLAFGAIRALEEAGLRVPEDVGVVGGNGADCMKHPPRFLTSTEHGLEVLGREMVRLLIRRIDLGGADVPAHIEPSRFLIGNTTGEAENRLLAAMAADRAAPPAVQEAAATPTA